MALTNPQEIILNRPTCCEYSGGRVFYGLRNTVYYSQVLEGVSTSNLEKCYQVNDPTSEHVSDLLATDGGVVQIGNATDIVQIKKFGGGVLIYAVNGVWYLAGSGSGFTATNFHLTQVSDTGCISDQSVVSLEASQLYWSVEGIYAISLNDQGNPTHSSLIESTMQTYYNNIPLASKKKATGAYNRIRKQVEWHYPKTAQNGADSFIHAFDEALVVDTKLGGVFPQEYVVNNDETASGYYIGSIVNTNQGTEDYDSMKVVMKVDVDVTNTIYSIVLGTKTDTDFKDFSITYPTAYIETGYETLDKPSNKKSAPYITTHFLQTEVNWIADGLGGLMLDNQSGCQMRAKWDWNNTDDNNRWSPSQQAYRFRRINIPDVAGTFSSGEQVITTKNKMLGRGNSMSIRFEQEANKDMQLLGYTVLYSVRGRM